MKRACFAVCLLVPFLASAQMPKADGYRGIWAMNQPSGDEFKYKYSGGLGTYPQVHIPIAYYSKEANKTFFCYGGTVEGKRELLHMVSYFDHATGKMPRPTLLINKKTDDAHDNPVLMLDEWGHIWIFSNSHGASRPSYLFRSTKPYSIDDFDLVEQTNFSYSQPWWIAGKGFLYLHTVYENKGRSLYWKTGAVDGGKPAWSPRAMLARAELGHYQASWRDGERVGTMFNFHPAPVGLNARTNLYYLETRDMGRTWKTVEGRAVAPPITRRDNPALVHDFLSEGLLVYLKNLSFDRAGRPVALIVTSRGYASGPRSGPRHFRLAHWTGRKWEIRTVAETDHNYDFGPLYIEQDGTWRVIAPTGPGPQRYGTGGEIEMWLSRDEGRSWKKIKQLTRNSRYNHSYVRKPVNAHPDFYALWADGDAFGPSPSSLYFTDRRGSHVWRLPVRMDSDFARPETAW